ncbi:SAM-dependent methyltransferase [Uliginosibacterium sp. 31-16]|uniref:class I SAM-dependent methyltransferase n=1 Tax=Uliginosibacterium sp. 31-16 TaxID=3068315 RepID=UPI00273E73C2|nr:SAM-dependent methyltransferase [Uliginosibacterium sp. 31-16]MDP5239398.1 SAM-dependent methyltransferase [Uliginosibacterium sp. 31-16]
MHTQLPPPGADALEHSARLAARIADEIRGADGWLSFARFMELALFAPGLGYYSGGAHKFGADGDFVTAPEISPLFGRALAAQVQQVLEASAPHVIEVGAGTGLLACDLLQELEARDCLPEHYDIIELSGELRVRQADNLRAKLPHLADRVRWLDALPEAFSGCILANEVLDVMSVQLVVWRDGVIFERGVVLDETGGFGWQDRPAEGRLLAAAQALPVEMPEEGEYLSEICLAARAWVAEWAPRLQQGAIILIDYGYPQAEYYLPSRSTGTLQCYYRHRAHPDVLLWPGLNDITSFVDFTAIADAAFAAGLAVEGYASQASFLTDCGLLELLTAIGPSDEAPYLRAARAALRLIAPHEMGELFKVLILGRGLELPLLGLCSGDRTHAL